MLLALKLRDPHSTSAQILPFETASLSSSGSSFCNLCAPAVGVCDHFVGWFSQPHDGSMVLLYRVTWIPSIYPPMLAYIPAPWILWVLIINMPSYHYHDFFAIKSHGNLRMPSSWTLLKGLVNVQPPRSINQPTGMWDICAIISYHFPPQKHRFSHFPFRNPFSDL